MGFGEVKRDSLKGVKTQFPTVCFGASLVAQMVKNTPVNAEAMGSIC